MLRCRGTALRSSRAWMQERCGSRGWERIRRRLGSPRVRSAWDGVFLHVAWYDAALLAELLDAAEDELAAPGAARALGARIAADDVQLANLAASGGRAAAAASRIFEEYWSHGRLEVIERSPGRVELALDNPGFPEIVCGDIMLGWGEHALARGGARAVSSEQIACVRRGASMCRYRATWTG